MHRLAPLLLIAILGCEGGSSRPASTKPQEPASAITSTRSEYAGEWEGGGVTLSVGRNISFAQSSGGATNLTYSGPLDHFDGDDIVMNIMIGKFTLAVQKPPANVGGVWKMTVNGVEVTRKPGSGGIPDQLELLIRKTLTDKGVTLKTVSCPRTKPPVDCTVETSLGDSFVAQGTLTGEAENAKIGFTMEAAILDSTKGQAFIEQAVLDGEKQVVTATCPPGNLLKAVGTTFTCDVVDKAGAKSVVKVFVKDKEGTINISR